MGREGQEEGILGVLALISVILFAAVLASFKIFNHDLFWHLKAGEWIAAGHSVPRMDMFSFTREGMEWIDAQWLFQLILWIFYSVGGAKGISLLLLLLCAGTAALLIFSAPGPALGMRALAGFLFLLSLNPRINCRPEILSCFYMAAIFFALERARQGARAWLVMAVVIQWLFVNSEGLWPIGLAIAGACGSDFLLETRRGGHSAGRSRIGPWLLAFSAMALLSFAQPYGTRGAIFPVELLLEVMVKGSPQKSLISEFQPLVFKGHLENIFLPYLLLGAASLFSVAASGRRARPMLALLGLLTAVLAFGARRNVGISSVVLTQVLLSHLSILGKFRPEFWRAPLFTRWCGILAVTGALSLSIYSLALPQRGWDNSGKRPGLGIEWREYPVETADYLKAVGYQGNIVNSENIGGYLIWSLWPGCKVFADPRMELGGQEAIILYLEAYNSQDKLARVAERFGVEAVAVTYRKPYTEFFQRMAADRRWALVHLDWNAAVFLRRNERWKNVIERDEIKDPLHYEVTRPSY